MKTETRQCSHCGASISAIARACTSCFKPVDNQPAGEKVEGPVERPVARYLVPAEWDNQPVPGFAGWMTRWFPDTPGVSFISIEFRAFQWGVSGHAPWLFRENITARAKEMRGFVRHVDGSDWVKVGGKPGRIYEFDVPFESGTQPPVEGYLRDVLVSVAGNFGSGGDFGRVSALGPLRFEEELKKAQDTVIGSIEWISAR